MKIVDGTLDPALSERVLERAQAFAKAFDELVQQGTPAARDGLSQVGDELMRATARVLIELARLAGQGGL